MVLSHISKTVSDIALAIAKALYPDSSNVSNSAAIAKTIGLRGKKRKWRLLYNYHLGTAEATQSPETWSSFRREPSDAGSVLSPIGSGSLVDDDFSYDFSYGPTVDDWYQEWDLKHSKRCRCFRGKPCKQGRQKLTSPRKLERVKEHAIRMSHERLKRLQDKSRLPRGKAGSTHLQARSRVHPKRNLDRGYQAKHQDLGSRSRYTISTKRYP